MIEHVGYLLTFHNKINISTFLVSQLQRFALLGHNHTICKHTHSYLVYHFWDVLIGTLQSFRHSLPHTKGTVLLPYRISAKQWKRFKHFEVKISNVKPSSLHHASLSCSSQTPLTLKVWDLAGFLRHCNSSFKHLFNCSLTLDDGGAPKNNNNNVSIIFWCYKKRWY